VLILAPTRELARPVAQQATVYGSNLRIKTVCISAALRIDPNRDLARRDSRRVPGG
jgi:superfamily II DNA/RNA helicase